MRQRISATIAAGALGGLLAGCSLGGGTASDRPLATNPPSSGDALASNPAASASGSPVQSSGRRTVLSPLGLNLRDADSKSANVIGQLARGTIVSVVAHSGNNGGWYQVRGQTVTGWISDDPQLTSPRTFNLFTSEQRGFSVLYLDTWTFAEGNQGVVFRPQGEGKQSITVTTAVSLDALGQPGRPGFTVSSADSTEVYGITGVLRRYDRTGTVQPSPGEPVPTDHLTEFRARIDSTRAIRIDFYSVDAADQQTFADFVDSVVIPPLSTPAPAPSP